MHRLHEDDLAGHVPAQEDWEVGASGDRRRPRNLDIRDRGWAPSHLLGNAVRHCTPSASHWRPSSRSVARFDQAPAASSAWPRRTWPSHVKGPEGRCAISAFHPKPRRQWRVTPPNATFGYLLVVNRSPRTQSYSWTGSVVQIQTNPTCHVEYLCWIGQLSAPSLEPISVSSLFCAIAANRHTAPPAPMTVGSIEEEKRTGWSLASFHIGEVLYADEVRERSRYGKEQRLG
jgi:hypothetical protein